MTTEHTLSAHEERLLQDFLQRRPKYLTLVNAIISALALGLMLWLFPDAKLPIVLAALAGSLIGVYFEHRHISELRTIFHKIMQQREP